MIKRTFDRIFSLVSLLVLLSLILFLFLISILDNRSFGLFIQNRIGQFGNIFKIYKIKTINPKTKNISTWSKILRKSKLDELPQLYNVVVGQMSFVGPRPDITGYADLLTGKEREFLQLKPGLTGLASLKYRNEEEILGKQENSAFYNDHIIWPDKVRLNNWYAANHSFQIDVMILFYTALPFIPFDAEKFMKDFGQ